MKYLAPLDETDPDASYHDGDEATSTLGSIPPGAAFEAVQREIVHVITESGMPPSGTDWTQLYQAIGGMITAALAGIDLSVLNAKILAAAPPGAVMFFARSTAPDGWLKGNGALVGRVPFLDLFDAIGTTFGVGDGSTTFALPDLRGEFLRGWDDSRGIDASRVFGSWQKGTLVFGDNDGASGYSPGAVGTTNPATDRSLIGLDPYNASDYTSASGGLGAVNNTQTPTTNPGNFGVSRPRNIALLGCIKY
jgi:phage-related tail fiber protein